MEAPLLQCLHPSLTQPTARQIMRQTLCSGLEQAATVSLTPSHLLWKPFLIRALLESRDSGPPQYIQDCSVLPCSHHTDLPLRNISSYCPSRALSLCSWLSIDSYRIELTSLLSVLFCLLEEKFLRKMGLAFLFLKQPPTGHGDTCKCCIHGDLMETVSASWPFPSPAHLDAQLCVVTGPPQLHFLGTEIWLDSQTLKHSSSHICTESFVYQAEEPFHSM